MTTVQQLPIPFNYLLGVAPPLPLEKCGEEGRAISCTEGNTMIRKVLGTKIAYRNSDHGGLEVTDDGENWYFTFRTWSEVEAMHPTLEAAPAVVDTEERDRELFGETLDEPILDDLYLELTAK
jgi:hypothetical protein